MERQTEWVGIKRRKESEKTLVTGKSTGSSKSEEIGVKTEKLESRGQKKSREYK